MHATRSLREMVDCSFFHSYKPIIRGCGEVVLVEDRRHLELLFRCARFLVIEHNFWQNDFLFSILDLCLNIDQKSEIFLKFGSNCDLFKFFIKKA